jgi:hypothetical protein
VIDKIRKGRDVARLLYYLYGPGKSDEHTDPHLVAGWRDPASVEPPVKPDGRRDFRRLAGLLNAPLDAVGRLGQNGMVWHCVLSASPADRLLSDEQWNAIASEFMHRMGLASRDDPAGVRWVAVRHGLSAGGIDHIHIAATLACQDGALPSVHNDYLRARKACLAIEEQFGLAPTAPADRTAAACPTRAETEQAARNGQPEPPRITLRRLVQETAAAALSEEDFFAQLSGSGELILHQYSTRDPGQVTGYAVALAGTASTLQSAWFSGGKLAPDLALPKLRRRWEHPRNSALGAPLPAAGLSPRSARAFLRSAACSAADQARNETGFFRHLAAAGVLVRHRHSDTSPGEITGYALSLPGHADGRGEPLWYSGGRLSADLTLPRLRRRWNSDTTRRVPRTLSPAERNAIWDDVIRITAQGATDMRRLAAADPAAAADAAWATADALRISARVIRGAPGRQIRRAADDFDRAARETHGTIPRQAPPGSSLRTASRLLAILGPAAGGTAVRLSKLITSLAALADAAAELRQAQQRTCQAAAARAAATRLTGLRQNTAQHMSPARSATAAESAPPARAAATTFPVPVRPQWPAPAPRRPRPPAQPHAARRPQGRGP